jgi:hypothetical protein
MAVTIQGPMPADNGMDAILEDLLSNPGREQIIVATVKYAKVTTFAGERKVTATVRLTQVEPVAYGTDDWQAVRKLLDSQREYRTGEVPLPLDE